MAGLVSCGGGSGGLNIESGVFGPNVSGTPDSFRGAGIVNDEHFLFGGPLAQGRRGDILLQNDKVRVILQKPTRNSGVGLFGGNILDADLFRPSSEPGQDQWGTIFPLVNLSWTVNYQRLEIVNADFGAGPVVVRATGILDVYDYIQTGIIVPFAKIFTGVDLFFSPRFDDTLNPFKNVPDLRGLNPIIVTEYTLKPDANYVIMETRFQNDGETPVKMPVGDWVNGSGTLEPFVPKQGFVKAARVEPIAALIYEGIEEQVGVSYGYFYNPVQFIKEDGSLNTSTSLTVSGVTPILLGESLLNVLPLNSGEPQINFSIEPGTRTITRYFVVGKGDVASVMDGGFSALGVSKLRLSGKVVDSGGQAVAKARVVVFDTADPDPVNHVPVTVAMSGANGEFSADLSAGSDVKDKMFGSGTYTVQVYKEGYVFSGGPKAGKCSGGSVDTAAKTVSGVVCTLGQSGTVRVSATENGAPTPARVTIVGFEPSPTHPYGDPGNFGKFGDVNLEERPYGIVDLFYLDPRGDIAPRGHHRLVGGNEFRLEPGEYEIFVTRGPEYSVFHQRVTVAGGAAVAVNAQLQKVLDTSGYVSADFHMHGIRSADSAWGLDSRVYAGLAEGMDVLVSSDHDVVTNYAPVIEKLGVGNLMTSIMGDEITPLAFGHMGVFPIDEDPGSPTGGAYDYTYTAGDDILNPDVDRVQSISEILQGVDEQYPGEQVLQINHIMDKATGNFAIAQLVTSTAFAEAPPLSSYADPVSFRMAANSNQAGGFQAPFPLGTSGAVSTDFTSLELTIGAYPDTLDHLMQTALPVYFNLLNLGVLATATADSDSHTQVREPIGTPRNYVASSVDPRDGIGTSFQAIDREELAANVNAHRLVASNGIFLRTKLSAAGKPDVSVGGMMVGTGNVTLEVEISSNEFFDWDRVEIYANTVPTPAKDDMSGVTDLSARDYHALRGGADNQKYLMAPLFQFSRGATGEGALNQSVTSGVRHATVTRNFNFGEDTWIVVLVRGSNGVRSLFPYVTKGASSSVSPETFLATLENNPAKIGGVRAFAFTNPLFVDVDGDGFKAMHIRDGSSPLAGH
ncbi:MAG TPA: hypothetical protein DF383_12155 [Deltaproteobacteria bacterium]|nr:hypothetical protein [Deltaproteobacteria bacterium]